MTGELITPDCNLPAKGSEDKPKPITREELQLLLLCLTDDLNAVRQEPDSPEKRAAIAGLKKEFNRAYSAFPDL